MKDYKYEQTEMTLNCGGEMFSLTANREIQKGFSIAMPNSTVDESSLPDISRGDTLPIAESDIQERMTGPPDYVSESDLITWVYLFYIPRKRLRIDQ